MPASLTLYRDMLRAASNFSNYNFREYALRHVRESFCERAMLSGDDAVQAYNAGRTQLEMLRRQATVSQLFPQGKHAMEYPADANISKQSEDSSGKKYGIHLKDL
jgi:hypothetical protein